MASESIDVCVWRVALNTLAHVKTEAITITVLADSISEAMDIALEWIVAADWDVPLCVTGIEHVDCWYVARPSVAGGGGREDDVV